jgi:hypothetical protein
MRYERAYARRQRAVTFAGSTRTITIPLETADFERLERLAIKHNLGNATLGREIIRKYLERQTDEELLRSRGSGRHVPMAGTGKNRAKL